MATNMLSITIWKFIHTSNFVSKFWFKHTRLYSLWTRLPSISLTIQLTDVEANFWTKWSRKKERGNTRDSSRAQFKENLALVKLFTYLAFLLHQNQSFVGLERNPAQPRGAAAFIFKITIPAEQRNPISIGLHKPLFKHKMHTKEL